MKHRYIVLRGSRLETRDAFRGSSTILEAAASEVKAQVEELESRDVAALAREADVVAVAPAMPMRLIAPRDVHEPDAAQAADPAWGVKAVKADTSPFTGVGVTVAVLDTGIDAKHPAFDGVVLVQKDFTGEGDGDAEGHGTHCAGTIFGRRIGGVRIGVAPGVTRALIGKVLGQSGGSSEQIVRAIQWAAENGAHVISMSLGIDFPGLVKKMIEEEGLPPDLATSRALEGYRSNVQLFERLASLIRARAQATLLVAAAGNESRRDVDSRYEISVSPPAVSEGIISVAAVGNGPGGLSIADFSNTGARVCGPGVEILSAKSGGGWVMMSGTSMATPHVAGVAALWAEKIRRKGPLTSSQLAARLEGNANSDAMRAGYDPADIGAGLVMAPQA